MNKLGLPFGCEVFVELPTGTDEWDGGICLPWCITKILGCAVTTRPHFEQMCITRAVLLLLHIIGYDGRFWGYIYNSQKELEINLTKQVMYMVTRESELLDIMRLSGVPRYTLGYWQMVRNGYTFIRDDELIDEDVDGEIFRSCLDEFIELIKFDIECILEDDPIGIGYLLDESKEAVWELKQKMAKEITKQMN